MSEDLNVPLEWKKFQSAVVEEKLWEGESLEELLLFEPEDPKTIHTFYRALKTKTLNADTLMLTAGMMCVRGDERFLPHFGLALQHGANPNLYAEYPSPEPDNPPILIHITTLFWLRAAFTEEETLDALYIQGKAVRADVNDEDFEQLQKESQRLILIIIAMLALAGADFEATVTTPQLLLEQGYNPTNFALRYPYYLDSIRSFMVIASIPGRDSWMLNRERFQLYSENRVDASRIYQSRFLNDTSRKNLFLMALFLDHYPILTIKEVYESPDILGLYFKFQARKTLNQLFSAWQASEQILMKKVGPDTENPLTFEEQTSRIRELDLMNLCLEYFNEDFFYRMLDSGIQAYVFPFNILTKLVLDARYLSALYPAQSQVLNSMIIRIARYGGTFGTDHYPLIESYSPSTLKAIEKELDVPIWKNACRALQSEDPADMNPDVLEIARQLNLALGSRPGELCSQMETLYQLDQPTLLKELKARQRRILESQTSKMRLIKAGAEENQQRLKEALFKDQTLSVEEIQAYTLRTAEQKLEDDRLQRAMEGKMFGNQDSLERAPEDYPEIDRVIYMSNNQYWIFTTNNYEELMRTGRNPWVNVNVDFYGEAIPEQVLLEIDKKVNLLTQYGLDFKAGSITYGVSSLYASSPSRTKEFHSRSIIRRNQSFFELASEYEISEEDFDRLSSDQITEMSEEVLDPRLRIVSLDQAYRLALDDFIDAVLIETSTFSGLESVMEKIKDYLESLSN